MWQRYQGFVQCQLVIKSLHFLKPECDVNLRVKETGDVTQTTYGLDIFMTSHKRNRV